MLKKYSKENSSKHHVRIFKPVVLSWKRKYEKQFLLTCDGHNLIMTKHRLESNWPIPTVFMGFLSPLLKASRDGFPFAWILFVATLSFSSIIVISLCGCFSYKYFTVGCFSASVSHFSIRQVTPGKGGKNSPLEDTLSKILLFIKWMILTCCAVSFSLEDFQLNNKQKYFYHLKKQEIVINPNQLPGKPSSWN